MIIRSTNKTGLLKWYGAIFQLAFVLAILLGRLEDPGLDFLTGFLMGFSVVGNLAIVCTYVNSKKSGIYKRGNGNA